MPLVIPSGYAQVTHFFEGEAAPTGAAVTYGINLSGDTADQQMAQDLHNLFSSNVVVFLTNDVSLVRTRLKAGPVTTGPVFEHQGVSTGNLDVNSTPPQVAALVTKRTARGGRRGRGRFYLPGLPENDVSNSGVFSGVAVTNLQGGLDDLLTGLAGVGFLTPMVVLHNSEGETVPGDPDEVTALVLSTQVATQRRRLRR